VKSAKRLALQNILLLTTAALGLVIVVYAFDVWAFSVNYYLRTHIEFRNVLFVQGLSLVLVGLLFMLGRGGINRWTLYVAILGSAADALYGRKGPSPSEVFRRDLWRAQGFIRFGLALIIAGAVLLAIYFLFYKVW